MPGPSSSRPTPRKAGKPATAKAIEPKRLDGAALMKARQSAAVTDALALYSSPSRDLDKMTIDEGLTLAFPDGPAIQTHRKHVFTPKRLANILARSLGSDGVGYALQINKDGTQAATASSGWARNQADGKVAWDTNTRMHIASVSKFFSCVALMRLLTQQGISFDRKVRDFLPVHWKIGSKAYSLTFDNIMSHRAGLWTSDSQYGALKREIETASNVIGESWHYANSNFGLVRILIPIIDGRMKRDVDYGHVLGFGISNDVAWDVLTRKHFNDFLQEVVWHPSGVSWASLKSTKAFWNDPVLGLIPAIRDAAIGYGYPPVASDTHGVDISDDLTSTAGADGWHVSCNELLLAANKIRRLGGIISRRMLNQMFTHGYGLFGRHRNGNVVINFHDGIWSGSGVSEWAYLGFIGNEYEIAVLTNNARDTPGKPSLGLLRDRVHAAYDQAVA